jgi:WD40 repeat protein
LDDLLPCLDQVEDLRILPLPRDLKDVYRQFLQRELGQNLQKDWHELYGPILGTLAVARGDGLTRTQLAGVVGRPSSEVDDILLTCTQYLTGNQPEGPFRIYHQSFREFLLENRSYQIYPNEANKAIARFFLEKYKNNWLTCHERYALQYTPPHLIEAMQQTELRQEGQLWSELEALLCDLHFVEAKCAAGLVYGLEADYDLALAALLEGQQEQERARAHQQEVAGYTQDMITYARAWHEARARHAADPTHYPIPAPKTISLPTIAAVRLWTDDEIQADTKQIICTPARLDRLRAFAAFVRAESHNLVQFATQPSFCVQQAYNSADVGPVVNAAERLLELQIKVPLLLQHPCQHAAYTPHPALLHVLVGHTGDVTSVSITPDGQTAISGSWDQTVRVWDLASGQCLRVLKGHTRGVSSVSITPDGQTAISGSWDQTVRVWDLASGECRHTLVGHTGDVTSVSITPDGQTAISGSGDRTVRVWDLTSGKCRHTLVGHSSKVTSVSVTPDGRAAISGSDDQTVRVWDLISGRCRRVLKLNEHSSKVITSVSVTPDGQTVVAGSWVWRTGGWDNSVRVWDLASGQRRRAPKLNEHSSFINSVSVTPDGQTAVAGYGSSNLGRRSDYTVQVWDLASGACRRILQGHSGYVGSVSVTPDGLIAISGSGDQTVRVWDLVSGKALHTLVEHAREVTSVCVTLDGRIAVSGSWDDTVRVWDLISGKCRHTLVGHSSFINSVRVTPDGRIAVSGSWDDTVRVWDLASGTCLHTLKGHTFPVTSVSVTPDGSTAVSGCGAWSGHGWDGTVRVWDLASGKALHTLVGHTREVISVCVTPDGRIAISGSADQTVRVWDLASGTCLHTLKGHTGPVTRVSVTPDGQTAISGGGMDSRGITDYTVRVWHLTSGECRYTLVGHSSKVTSVSVTPDGRIAVSGSWDGTVRVWDLISGKCRHTLVGHTDCVMSLSITPYGRTAVSAGDRTVRVWDLASGQCLALFPAPSRVTSLSEITAGGLLGVGTDGGEVIFVSLRNVRFAPLRITAVRLWLRSGRKAKKGCWDDQITTRCVYCEQSFVPPSQVLDAIHGLTAHLAPNQSPCLELPPEAWDEPGLLSECPQCHQPVQFNPFVVDRRKAKL